MILEKNTKNIFEKKYKENLPAILGRKNNPLINILTRTSNRSNYFNRCCDSIDAQTYKKINHIVATDNKNDIAYVEKRWRKPILINCEELIKNDNSPKLTPPYSPHNLYFNVMHNRIQDGWVIYLDDDDYFRNKYTVERIVNLIDKANEDTMFIWRMTWGNGYLPIIIDKNNPPKLGEIGGSCFTFNKKYIEHINWDSWKCSDFRIIDKLYKIMPFKVFIPEVFIIVPIANGGNKRDIKKWASSMNFDFHLNKFKNKYQVA
jgi:hypothetical protein